LVLHGFPTSSWDFADIIPNITIRYRVVVFGIFLFIFFFSLMHSGAGWVEFAGSINQFFVFFMFFLANLEKKGELVFLVYLAFQGFLVFLVSYVNSTQLCFFTLLLF
jgi:hypothetical protein